MYKKDTTMLSEAEIVSTIMPINGTYINIPNLSDYARQIIERGKCISLRNENTNELKSYILYYDNGPVIFITMVLTNPKHQRLGLASQLINHVIHSSNKDIDLEVHKDNPARYLYDRLKFIKVEEHSDTILMSYRKRLAIMQPYIFPYIGYYHLIESSSTIVFYDDVNYIKRGWINKNRIINNDKDYLFTVPLISASQNRLINETSPCINTKWKDAFYNLLRHTYHNAPYWSHVADRIVSVFEIEYANIADMAIQSIVTTYDYLGLEIHYTKSSVCAPETKGMEKADRLIEITKALGFTRYVNSPGGMSLYSKDYFRSKGIDLSFVKSDYIEYKQYNNDFIPWLSIIDVLMFCDKDTIGNFLSAYTLA